MKKYTASNTHFVLVLLVTKVKLYIKYLHFVVLTASMYSVSPNSSTKKHASSNLNSDLL